MKFHLDHLHQQDGTQPFICCKIQIYYSQRKLDSMIRQRSFQKIKPPPREKSKTPSNSSQIRGPQPPNRTQKLEHPSHGQHNPSVKVSKQDSKSKINKLEGQAHRPKQSNSHKNSPDSHSLHMKANLKQLISKNTAHKPTTGGFVPDLLKNIEKHCKELKKIHEKQQKVYGKRISLQQNKLEKDKRMSSGNRSHQFQGKKKKQSSREHLSRDLKQPEQNRYSLQIKQKDQRQAEAQTFTNEVLAKRTKEGTENNKNFVQLFKIYKKSFQVEDLKIGKSNKNTNYNTNQSKNSSSLLNSHGYSALGDHNYKNRSKVDEKANLDKIQTLIRSQQSSLSRQNSSNKKIKGSKGSAQSVKKLQKSLEKPQEMQKGELQQNQSLQIKEEVEFQSPQQHCQPFKHSKDVQIPEVVVARGAEENNGSKENSGKKPFEREHLERQFQGSKFYVRPIPKLRQSRGKEEQKEEDSLAGCEITLIEDNIICEDSDQISLEL